jgi:hypothetical protein
MYAVILLLLSNDHKKGVNLAFKLIRILNDHSTVEIGAYSDALRLILFPTVFDGPEWVTYEKIDETHFCKKMTFYKPKRDNQDINKSNQKAQQNTSGAKIQRNEAIALEFDKKNIQSKNIGAPLAAMLPTVRSVSSILAIEL